MASFRKFILAFMLVMAAQTAYYVCAQTETPQKPLLLVPLNPASVWTMSGGDSGALTDFDSQNIAQDPGESGKKAAGSVYFGVPPKSASAVVSLGVTGEDIDRFLSATSFKDTSYERRFGYLAFDKDSLSAGVSGKFLNDITTSLYYNGNIVEDLFAYISNNPLTNGKVGLGAMDNLDGINYDFIGDLKDRNSINSRNNISLMFGKGFFGVTVGYSQKLLGRAKKSTADPERIGVTNDALIYNTQEAALDNAIVPNVEFGFRFAMSKAVIKAALGFQADIHQHRELVWGSTIQLTDYFLKPQGTTYAENAGETRKLSADYIEPAATLRIEAEFPSRDRSRFGIALETAGRIKLYSNMDDRGGGTDGVFWSYETAAGDYFNSVTQFPLDLEVLARPSVRYTTALRKNFSIGLNGGFGAGFKFGSSVTRNYKWAGAQGKADYIASGNPYGSANLEKTVNTVSSLDLALYPNLGAGFSFDAIPGTLTLNGGIGAAQTLYSIRMGAVETKKPGLPTEKQSVLEQSWGKPFAQFALGATFRFKESYTLDALFFSNGTDFDNANFVIQFSARL